MYRPGTSCLRMHQIFIVFVVGKKKIKICTQKMQYTKDAASQEPGELPVVLQHNYSDPGQLHD